ncbi:MAG: hypothetical protein L6Q92_14090 [Phycisphaerae bacterium]|nr:hypothetical protein [Phycisphaerae bacterium]
MTFRRIGELACLAIILMFTSGCPVPQQPGKGKQSVISEPRTGAQYFLYLPEAYVKNNGRHPNYPDRRWPLVMTFHGMKPYDTWDRQAHEWEHEADNYGYIVCAPWLQTCDSFMEYPLRREHSYVLNDRERVIAIMDHVFQTTRADPKAVLSTSWSCGGYLAHYFPNRFPDRFRCIATRLSNFSADLLLESTVPRYRDVPVAIYIGDGDFPACKSESEDGVAWYKARGFPVTGKMIDNTGHRRIPHMAAAFFAEQLEIEPLNPAEAARALAFERMTDYTPPSAKIAAMAPRTRPIEPARTASVALAGNQPRQLTVEPSEPQWPRMAPSPTRTPDRGASPISGAQVAQVAGNSPRSHWLEPPAAPSPGPTNRKTYGSGAPPRTSPPGTPVQVASVPASKSEPVRSSITPHPAVATATPTTPPRTTHGRVPDASAVFGAMSDESRWKKPELPPEPGVRTVRNEPVRHEPSRPHALRNDAMTQTPPRAVPTNYRPRESGPMAYPKEKLARLQIADATPRPRDESAFLPVEPPAPRKSPRAPRIGQKRQMNIRLTSAIGTAPLYVMFNADLPAAVTAGADFMWQDNGVWIPEGHGPRVGKIFDIPGKHRITVLMIAANGDEYRGEAEVVVVGQGQPQTAKLQASGAPTNNTAIGRDSAARSTVALRNGG